MLRLAVAALAGICFISSAIAADIPAKAAAKPAIAVAPAAPLWSGFYAGIAGGYGWGEAEQTDDIPFSSGTYDIDGWIVGGTLGANWQTGALVYGLEADLSWAEIFGTTTGASSPLPSAPCIDLRCSSEVRALFTARARIGYAWGNFLPFLTAGWAYADVWGSEGRPALGGEGSQWVSGWTAGGGLEWMLTPQWTGKAEYLYVDLGKHHVFDDLLGGGAVVAQSLDINLHVVRAGLNYRFTTW